MAPWSNKTGPARLIAIFASALGIATGLCGMNFLAVLRFVPLDGPGRMGPPTAHDRLMDALGNFLTVAGVVELVVMGISVMALAVLWIYGSGNNRKD